jgi:anti-anti-sigma regulatory factor
MANYFVEIKNGKAIVHVEGSVVIDTTTQLHQTFSEALESQLSVILDIDKTTDCDSTFVQLISSLCYTLNQGGRTLEFGLKPMPEPISQTIKAIGFHFRCNCTRMKNVECLFTKVEKSTEQNQENLR